MSGTSSNESIRAIQALMRQLGVRAEDLADAPRSISVATFTRDNVLGALTAAQRQAWRPYIAATLEGLAGLCACTCAACISHMDGVGRFDACACVRTGHCACSASDLAGTVVEATSCLESCPVLGERELADVTLAELETLSHWVQARATKRTLVRNAARARDGRTLFAYDGRSAVEHLRSFLSALYNLALEDRTTGVTRNVALKMNRYPRPDVQKRSYEANRLSGLWHALYTSGSDDVELDEMIVWFILETGARRGALIQLKVGDLLVSAGAVRLHEKKNKVDEQPVSTRLMEGLLSMALERGDVIAKNPEGLAPEEITLEHVRSRRVTLRSDRPVFYYRRPRRTRLIDGTVVESPHPLSERRFNSLWDRLKRELAWLEEIHGRPHDLRKTVGTLVERELGYAVAQAVLRHSPGNVTGTYVAAGAEDKVRAHAWLIGRTAFEDAAEEW